MILCLITIKLVLANYKKYGYKYLIKILHHHIVYLISNQHVWIWNVLRIHIHAVYYILTYLMFFIWFWGHVYNIFLSDTFILRWNNLNRFFRDFMYIIITRPIYPFGAAILCYIIIIIRRRVQFMIPYFLLLLLSFISLSTKRFSSERPSGYARIIRETRI